ncbi:MAG: four helix bundle protein [Flavobacteriales bacterium]|nr:four helix bundle protein [Flavobacteriales bacterium]
MLKRETGKRKLETGNGKRETGNWKLETGNWKLETGNGKRETGNGKRETGNGKRETGNRKREKMEGQTHRDLKERTMQFSAASIRFYQKLPMTTEAQVCGKQFLRSATSVGANTRSAFRGRSPKEFKAKLGVVIEEADECGFWLELMQNTGIIEAKPANSLLLEASELVSIFTTIVKR